MGRFDSGPPLMKTKEIREQLREQGLAVQRLEAELKTARSKRAELVRAANADPELSMVEVARLAGVSRVSAYEMLD